MVQRLQYRRRHCYATKSNTQRILKTPGGKLTFQTVKKRANGPMCGDKKCNTRLHGVRVFCPPMPLDTHTHTQCVCVLLHGMYAYMSDHGVAAADNIIRLHRRCRRQSSTYVCGHVPTDRPTSWRRCRVTMQNGAQHMYMCVCVCGSVKLTATCMFVECMCLCFFVHLCRFHTCDQPSTRIRD